METRAPHALIGLFVLTVIAAGFGFVYWLHNSGGLTERTVYRVRFENTVSGLLTGAAVSSMASAWARSRILGSIPTIRSL
jgi:phospholipid/cholesterol/gamma-HCH transport system substrate-binding protein